MPTIIVGIGALMGTTSMSAVNTALPTLTEVFEVSPATIAWVALAQGLTTGTLATVFGRLSDMVSRKRLYALGIVVTVVGSALCALSPNVELLIGFRVLQAIGTALMAANSLAYLIELYPADRRGFVVGAFEACIAAGLALGPVIGGLLLALSGWQSIFYVNVPFGVILLAFIPKLLRETPRSGRKQQFDVVGAVTFAVALVPLMFALTRGYDLGWTSLPLVACLATSGAGLLAFIATERRVRQPMVDLGMFRSPGFSAGNLAKVCGYFGFAANSLLLPFYWDRVLHLPSATLGLVLTAFPIGMLVGSVVFGPLSDRVGTRILGPAGLLALAAAGLIQTWVVGEMGYLPVLVAAALGGLGIGAFIAPNDSAILAVTPRDKLGVANGIMSVSRTLGILSGQATAAGLLSARLVANAGDFTSSYHEVFAVIVAVTLAGVALAAVRDRPPEDPR